ncbi:MAG: hypothetical protein V4629_12970 [Pseudomonadota bacterium]
MYSLTAFQSQYFCNQLPHSIARKIIHPVRLSRFVNPLQTYDLKASSFKPSRLSRIQALPLHAEESFDSKNITENANSDLIYYKTNEGAATESLNDNLGATDHPIFTTPEAYHEANQIYLKSQERYPFRFPIINPNHLRANETFIDTFGRYKIYVVQAQHNDTQELVPHVVTYVKRWGKQVVDQLALPVSILPWVIDSIQEAYQPGSSIINPPYKQSMGLSQKIFEDMIRVRMEVIPDVRLTGRGDDCTICIMGMRRCSNGQASVGMRGDPLLMATDLITVLKDIYLQHASPDEANVFLDNLMARLFKK